MKNQSIYLAYGSNLNLLQMARRCPTAEVLGATEIQGCDLKFRGKSGYAVATVEPGEGKVPALLWEITAADERALDRYEDWPRLYRKETMMVELDGEQAEAMVYIMNDGYDLGAPHPLYFSIIKDGYRSAGFDTAVLDEALHRSFSEQEPEMEMG